MKVLLVDDSADDRQRIADRLGHVPGVVMHTAPPPEKMDWHSLVEQAPDAVLVDYQLSGKEEGRPAASYRGSTLAALLREKLPNHPIVLITRAQLKSAGRFAPARDVEGAFDELLIKREIYDTPAAVGKTLMLLTTGFKLLAGVRKDWPNLRTILGATREEDEQLLVADPPEAVLHGETWRVAEVARWVRATLLKYPGIFYDSLHAASLLGIDVKSYLRPSVQQFFQEARYTGPFASGAVVWKGRFLSLARELLRNAGLQDAPLTNFATAWRKLRRVALPQAVCIWSHETPADSVCFILKKPVMRRHSLLYRPDTRPAIMDPARVSFRAIRESDDYEERLLAPDSRALAREVQREQSDA
ncbi:MAG TPA: response regulator [Thermoanaerobaculia bacterium]|nr:response regulator [Thermoanaerobaculia bacterium]